MLQSGRANRHLPVVPLRDYLTFSAKAFPPPEGQNEFSALCGDNPPTIVDGYGKWNVVDRPLRQGLTIPAGFNPAKVKIEIRFGIWDGRFGFNGWDTSPSAAEANEIDIDSLHWMAGGNQIAGASPAIRVEAKSDKTHKPIKLFPKQYRGVAWVIDGGIEWGNSLREPTTGGRIYQEATFTLLGFLELGVKPPKPSNTQGGGYFKVTTHIRTILAIASAHSGRTPAADRERLAHQISGAHQNNPCRASRVSLGRKSITHFKLPIGLEVWVPGHPTF